MELVGAGTVDELRSIPTDIMRKASHAVSGVVPQPGKVHTPANLVWVPVPDELVDAAGFPGTQRPVQSRLAYGCSAERFTPGSGSAAEESPMTRTSVRAALFTVATLAVVIVAVVANARPSIPIPPP